MTTKKIIFLTILPIFIIFSLFATFFVYSKIQTSKKNKTTSLSELPKLNTNINSLDHLKATQFVEQNTPSAFGVDTPDSQGALGVNKKTGQYSSVRWQMETYSLTIKALTTQKDQDFDNLNKVINYSFSHQLEDGSFEFAVPKNLVGTQKTPNEGDLASGAAFYLSTLGSSLDLIQNNLNLVQKSAKGKDLLNNLENLKPKFELSLKWLSSKSEILKIYDSKAPNRLMFDALAYYGLGKYLQKTEAKSLGLEFINLSLKLQNDSGIFDENGFDSSYQAVNMLKLQQFYFLIKDDSNVETKKILESIKKATDIELTKILSTGEISTEGNGRVFDGGETFLGKEKQIAVPTVVQAFGLSAYIFNDQNYQLTSRKIYDFYRNK